MSQGEKIDNLNSRPVTSFPLFTTQSYIRKVVHQAASLTCPPLSILHAKRNRLTHTS